MKYSFAFALLISSSATVLTSSCLKDDEVDYSEWRERNTEYFETQEALTQNGKPVYNKLAPDWAPEAYFLIKWISDPTLTAKNLMPLDNSTVNVKYAVDDIDGKRISDSYSMRINGDSIYQCQPNDNITGFWTALVNMHVGDHVKCILPANAAYGNLERGEVKPYSTLIYDIELVSIPDYETPKH